MVGRMHMLNSRAFLDLGNFKPLSFATRSTNFLARFFPDSAGEGLRRMFPSRERYSQVGGRHRLVAS
eukprot:7920015-Pyramimonas_sp.AAC.1